MTPIDSTNYSSILQVTGSTDPTSKGHRWDVIQRGDGKIFVRTHNLWNQVSASLHKGYFTSVEEAREEIARQRSQIVAAELASKETILYSEEL